MPTASSISRRSSGQLAGALPGHPAGADSSPAPRRGGGWRRSPRRVVAKPRDRRWTSSAGSNPLARADSPAAKEHRLPRAQLHQPRARNVATAAPRPAKMPDVADVLHQGADDGDGAVRSDSVGSRRDRAGGLRSGARRGHRRGGRNISRANALAHVFGYTVINDVSARDLQYRHKQWFKGKSLDGFCPMGPCIVTADEFGDPQKAHFAASQRRDETGRHDGRT